MHCESTVLSATSVTWVNVLKFGGMAGPASLWYQHLTALRKPARADRSRVAWSDYEGTA